MADATVGVRSDRRIGRDPADVVRGLATKI
jgi:hypothetical protein